MNTVFLQGNLTRDPEIRVTNDGRKRALFCVAVNESFGDEERVHYVDVTAFSGQNGNFADNIVTSLGKGQRVLVAGRLNTYQRTVKFVDDDGNESEVKKRTMLSLTASEVGPGLRFATAQVDRNPLRGSTTETAAAAAEPAPTPAAAAADPAPTPAAAASDAEAAF